MDKFEYTQYADKPSFSNVEGGTQESIYIASLQAKYDELKEEYAKAKTKAEDYYKSLDKYRDVVRQGNGNCSWQGLGLNQLPKSNSILIKRQSPSEDCGWMQASLAQGMITWRGFADTRDKLSVRANAAKATLDAAKQEKIEVEETTLIQKAKTKQLTGGLMIGVVVILGIIFLIARRKR